MDAWLFVVQVSLFKIGFISKKVILEMLVLQRKPANRQFIDCEDKVFKTARLCIQ